MNSIVVFRALQLGDLICTVPAFRAIREAYPAARITLVGLPWAQLFVRRYSAYIDDFIEFPGYPGLPEIPPRLGKIPDFFREIQKKHFDLAIQMHGSGSYVNSIVAIFNAKQTAGFYREGDYRPSDLFMPYPEGEHEIRQSLKLLSFLGIPLRGEDLEFPILAEDDEQFRQLSDAFHLKNDYVCIHAGSRLLSRRWGQKNFARVADGIHGMGFQVVLTGSQDEKEMVDEVESQMKCSAVNVAGKTSLGVLAALVRSARLLVCNDTGVSHIAAAMKTPSVVIVTGSDPKRWAPLNNRLHRIVMHAVECRPCYFFECPIGQPCAAQVNAASVLEEAQMLLMKGNLCAA
jgi:ADP-heptose:LPS heptosyltransferase